MPRHAAHVRIQRRGEGERAFNLQGGREETSFKSKVAAHGMEFARQKGRTRNFGRTQRQILGVFPTLLLPRPEGQKDNRFYYNSRKEIHLNNFSQKHLRNAVSQIGRASCRER